MNAATNEWWTKFLVVTIKTPANANAYTELNSTNEFQAFSWTKTQKKLTTFSKHWERASGFGKIFEMCLIQMRTHSQLWIIRKKSLCERTRDQITETDELLQKYYKCEKTWNPKALVMAVLCAVYLHIHLLMYVYLLFRARLGHQAQNFDATTRNGRYRPCYPEHEKDSNPI